MRVTRMGSAAQPSRSRDVRDEPSGTSSRRTGQPAPADPIEECPIDTVGAYLRGRLAAAYPHGHIEGV